LCTGNTDRERIEERREAEEVQENERGRGGFGKREVFIS
jgi:hypothetical protein